MHRLEHGYDDAKRTIGMSNYHTPVIRTKLEKKFVSCPINPIIIIRDIDRYDRRHLSLMVECVQEYLVANEDRSKRIADRKRDSLAHIREGSVKSSGNWMSAIFDLFGLWGLQLILCNEVACGSPDAENGSVFPIWSCA